MQQTDTVTNNASMQDLSSPSEPLGGGDLADGGRAGDLSVGATPANDVGRAEHSIGHLDQSHSESDNETVIFLDAFDERNQSAGGAFDWMEPANEEHRRTILQQELHRVQRAAFVQFASLCLFPIVVIVFVIVTAVRDEALCGSAATNCYPEARSFLNAFTTRCVCDPITVLRNDTEL